MEDEENYITITGKQKIANEENEEVIKEFQEEFIPNTIEVNLEEKGLIEVDLSPVSQMRDLKKLLLADNNLTHIDLTPLKSLDNFERIYLSRNNLESVDFKTLGELENLTILHLSGNPLSEVNLEPLRGNQHLEILYLQHTEVKEIDLSPLKDCTSLFMLKLDPRTEVKWNGDKVDKEDLPYGLRPFYREKI